MKTSRTPTHRHSTSTPSSASRSASAGRCASPTSGLHRARVDEARAGLCVGVIRRPITRSHPPAHHPEHSDRSLRGGRRGHGLRRGVGTGQMARSGCAVLEHVDGSPHQNSGSVARGMRNARQGLSGDGSAFTSGWRREPDVEPYFACAHCSKVGVTELHLISGGNPLGEPARRAGTIGTWSRSPMATSAGMGRRAAPRRAPPHRTAPHMSGRLGAHALSPPARPRPG